MLLSVKQLGWLVNRVVQLKRHTVWLAEGHTNKTVCIVWFSGDTLLVNYNNAGLRIDPYGTHVKMTICQRHYRHVTN